jgi:hypothetical protein
MVCLENRQILAQGLAATQLAVREIAHLRVISPRFKFPDLSIKIKALLEYHSRHRLALRGLLAGQPVEAVDAFVRASER